MNEKHYCDACEIELTRQQVTEADGHICLDNNRCNKRAGYLADVSRPGKFEGEPIYTPYFYDMYMEGDGEYLDNKYQKFNITEEDLYMFPELKDCKDIYLYFSDDGFVYAVDNKEYGGGVYS